MPRELFRVDELTMSHQEARRRIADNLEMVLQDVASAMSIAGRAGDVRVVGVSKYVDEHLTRWLVEAGCRDLGENRPQVLMSKHEALLDAGAIRWHQIGHVQRNKVRKLLLANPIVHSVDSARLFDEIAGHAAAADQQVEVLIELNISGESAKTGLPPDELIPMIQAKHGDRHVNIIGLMAMAGWGTKPDVARRQFANLRQIRDRAAAESGMAMPELSMGMSGDYAEAIAEGATMVRIGSRLFDGVLPR